ncbi:hypothetical protein G7Y89_g7868 [Cudoniella acicularis]|uniref:SGNH hydrolase-type esterase domain-containing protein n=1 Tax=Cudoniella acicularis TaxID=354080 RepID=A0A8H4RL89_9HELO|nr:hypothetical protein G7Y89_g7868 [Cudoniella acicularis]
MKLSLPSLFATIASSPTTASALPSHAHQNKPAAFYLAGDSTTAAQSAGGGGTLALPPSFLLRKHPNLKPGWGVGFLKTLVNGAIGTDLGYNGATTESFVAGGAWANVIDAVNRAKVDYTPYVTIQFGHNDQKPAANISIEEFSANLKELATEALAAGGMPILVTSISRRNFNSSSLVIEDLAPQRAATIAVATSMNVSYIDLNEASTKYLDSIGSADAATYNRIPTDFTHLNPAGSVLFGAMNGGGGD